MKASGIPVIAILIAALCFFCGIAIASMATIATEKPARPNIICILADDLGWANVGFHGPNPPRSRR